MERGTGQSWLALQDPGSLGDGGLLVQETLARQGASFFADLQAATGLGTRALRDALRELVAAELVTSDAPEAMRDVARWRPMPPVPGHGAPDPTRWLPEGFAPTRPVVQRRANLRRLPKWRRPDVPGAVHEAAWRGRWTLLRTPGVLGAPLADEERAELVARQWLERYGIVSRDWWRRERPPVSWRSIYHELKRMELRGEVRRGYFVQGLGGAQFALPNAVELLRAAKDDAEAPMIVMSASDPANPYSLNLDNVPRVAHERPRGRGAMLVTRGGRVLLSAERGGRRLFIAPDLSAEETTAAARALLHRLTEGSTARRDVIVESVNGDPAVTSPFAASLGAAGLRATTSGLRYYSSR
jgi:ATP-dependent Lhr-like helicase